MIKNTKTALMANKNPNNPSRSNPESCSSTSGPSFCRMRISMSSGSPWIASRAASAAEVTSTVLESGSFSTTRFRLGLPLVREMLAESAAPNSTLATSHSRTGRSPR